MVKQPLLRLSLALGMAAAVARADAQVIFTSVEQVWQYADAHNTAIKNAQYETEKGRYGRQQAYMDFLPDVSANGTATDNTTIQTTLIPAVIFGGPANTYTPVQFGQKYIYNGSISAQLDIVNLQTAYNFRIARETETLNKASLRNTKRNTYQQIAAQYYACLLNKEALLLAKKSAMVSDSVLQTVTNRFDEGTVAAASVDVAKLNSERALQTSITAEYQLQSSLNSLKALLGLNVSDSIEIGQDMHAKAFASSGAPFAEDPSIQLAYAQTRLNLDKFRSTRAGIYPTLSMQYFSSKQQYDNTFRPFESGGPKWFPANYWALKASWTIFNGGNRWVQSHKNRLTYLQSVADAEQATRQSAINDENLRLAYKKAEAMLTKSEHIMKLSFDNYYHMSQRYDEGVATLDDKLRAFSDYISYQNQYLNSLSDMLIQMYNYKLRQQQF